MSAYRVPNGLLLACFITFAAVGWPRVHRAQQELLDSATTSHSMPKAFDQEPVPGIAGPLFVNTDLVTFNITVIDPQGRFVSGLKKDAFTIYDDKQPQTIEFFSADDTPLSIGIVFDVSGSMSGERINRAREALTHFFEVSDQRDDYFLLGFNSRAQLLVDYTNNTGALLSTLAQVEPQGNTALLDAIYLAVSKLQRAPHERRAVLLITDGGENNSHYKLNQVSRLLKESGVMLYSIGVLNRIDLVSKTGFSARVLLEELAKATGGRGFFPQGITEMDDDFQNIALELRHQYSVGYKPKDLVLDGKWHHLKVAIRPTGDFPRLMVRNKQGYFALSYPR